MIQDVQPVQKRLEAMALAQQDSVEQAALSLYKTDEAKAIALLTAYCASTGNEVVKEWRELGQFLVMKYIDGYINDERGSGQTAG